MLKILIRNLIKIRIVIFLYTFKLSCFLRRFYETPACERLLQELNFNEEYLFPPYCSCKRNKKFRFVQLFYLHLFKYKTVQLRSLAK